jgi:hypothetical protein
MIIFSARSVRALKQDIIEPETCTGERKCAILRQWVRLFGVAVQCDPTGRQDILTTEGMAALTCGVQTTQAGAATIGAHPTGTAAPQLEPHAHGDNAGLIAAACATFVTERGRLISMLLALAKRRSYRESVDR